MPELTIKLMLPRCARLSVSQIKLYVYPQLRHANAGHHMMAFLLDGLYPVDTLDVSTCAEGGRRPTTGKWYAYSIYRVLNGYIDTRSSQIELGTRTNISCAKAMHYLSVVHSCQS
jgi:hypothetical protein